MLETKVPMEFEYKVREGRVIRIELTTELFQKVPCCSSWLTINLIWSGLIPHLDGRISLGNPEKPSRCSPEVFSSPSRMVVGATTLLCLPTAAGIIIPDPLSHPFLLQAPPFNCPFARALKAVHMAGCCQRQKEQARAGKTDKEDWTHTGLQPIRIQTALEVQINPLGQSLLGNGVAGYRGGNLDTASPSYRKPGSR